MASFVKLLFQRFNENIVQMYSRVSENASAYLGPIPQFFKSISALSTFFYTIPNGTGSILCSVHLSKYFQKLGFTLGFQGSFIGNLIFLKNSSLSLFYVSNCSFTSESDIDTSSIFSLIYGKSKVSDLAITQYHLVPGVESCQLRDQELSSFRVGSFIFGVLNSTFRSLGLLTLGSIPCWQQVHMLGLVSLIGCFSLRGQLVFSTKLFFFGLLS